MDIIPVQTALQTDLRVKRQLVEFRGWDAASSTSGPHFDITPVPSHLQPADDDPYTLSMYIRHDLNSANLGNGGWFSIGSVGIRITTSSSGILLQNSAHFAGTLTIPLATVAPFFQNKLCHFCMTTSVSGGTSTTKVYLNSKLVKENSEATGTWNNINSHMRIHRGSTSWTAIGGMSDVQFYIGSAFTEAEVLSLYHSGFPLQSKITELMGWWPMQQRTFPDKLGDGKRWLLDFSYIRDRFVVGQNLPPAHLEFVNILAADSEDDYLGTIDLTAQRTEGGAMRSFNLPPNFISGVGVIPKLRDFELPLRGISNTASAIEGPNHTAFSSFGNGDGVPFTEFSVSFWMENLGANLNPMRVKKSTSPGNTLWSVSVSNFGRIQFQIRNFAGSSRVIRFNNNLKDMQPNDGSNTFLPNLPIFVCIAASNSGVASDTKCYTFKPHTGKWEVWSGSNNAAVDMDSGWAADTNLEINSTGNGVKMYDVRFHTGLVTEDEAKKVCRGLKSGKEISQFLFDDIKASAFATDNIGSVVGLAYFDAHIDIKALDGYQVNKTGLLRIPSVGIKTEFTANARQWLSPPITFTDSVNNGYTVVMGWMWYRDYGIGGTSRGVYELINDAKGWAALNAGYNEVTAPSNSQLTVAATGEGNSAINQISVSALGQDLYANRPHCYVHVVEPLGGKHISSNNQAHFNHSVWVNGMRLNGPTNNTVGGVAAFTTGGTMKINGKSGGSHQFRGMMFMCGVFEGVIPPHIAKQLTVPNLNPINIAQLDNVECKMWLDFADAFDDAGDTKVRDVSGNDNHMLVDPLDYADVASYKAGLQDVNSYFVEKG